MTGKTSLESVKEFYVGFEQEEHLGKFPGDISDERLHLKLNLIAEEFIELIEAAYGKEAGAILKIAWMKAQKADEGNRDLVELADALADLRYVENGLALEAAIPLETIFTIVHESNMSKLGEDGKPVISDGVTPASYDGEIKPKGKLLKGPNYFEPTPKIKEILGVQ